MKKIGIENRVYRWEFSKDKTNMNIDNVLNCRISFLLSKWLTITEFFILKIYFLTWHMTYRMNYGHFVVSNFSESYFICIIFRLWNSFILSENSCYCSKRINHQFQFERNNFQCIMKTCKTIIFFTCDLKWFESKDFFSSLTNLSISDQRKQWDDIHPFVYEGLSWNWAYIVNPRWHPFILSDS